MVVPEALDTRLWAGKVRYGLLTQVGSSLWRSAMGSPGGVSLAAKTDGIVGWFPRTGTARENVRTLRSWSFGLRTVGSL